jgi:hypothetical protein
VTDRFKQAAQRCDPPRSRAVNGNIGSSNASCSAKTDDGTAAQIHSHNNHSSRRCNRDGTHDNSSPAHVAEGCLPRHPADRELPNIKLAQPVLIAWKLYRLSPASASATKPKKPI